MMTAIVLIMMGGAKTAHNNSESGHSGHHAFMNCWRTTPKKNRPRRKTNQSWTTKTAAPTRTQKPPRPAWRQSAVPQ
eukprot:8298463-Lingulodinium_polyedra.AAC.1